MAGLQSMERKPKEVVDRQIPRCLLPIGKQILEAVQRKWFGSVAVGDFR